ncbi:MAG: LacI family DNA-binding transcriptional regulator [Erysipelotrichaceae bacterium]
MKRITIYDVAHEADVSLATVSRVINGSDIVKKDTRERVQAAIEKLGYKPNAIAQGLALQKTTTIALVVPEASFFYTGQIINGLIDVAKIYKYNIVLHTTTEGISETTDIIESIIKSRADGVVIFNDKLSKEDLSMLTGYNVPIVIIGDKVSGDIIGSVFVDFAQMIYDFAADYLDRGLTNIAIVEDRKNPITVNQLHTGLKQLYQDRGMEFNNFISIPKEYRSSYLYLQEYFKENKHDLVITYRDSQALAVLNTATEHGIHVCNDMEIVCVLDTKYNAMARPQISGFQVPDYDLGAVAMRLITKMLNTDEEEFDKEIELSYIYKSRKSTK